MSPDDLGRRPEAPPPAGEVLVVAGERWAAAAAAEIAKALEGAAQAGGASRSGPRTSGHGGRRLSLALSGGSTPGPVYRALAGTTGVDWSEIEVVFADERFVPPDHPESNFRLVRETLLEPLGEAGPGAHFAGKSERRGADSVAATAGRYAAVLPASIDVVVLGIGADGHIASLFPGDPRIGAPKSSRAAIPVIDAPKAPARRVSLSPDAIVSARFVVVLARGVQKAAAVREALEGAWNPLGCPAQLARRGTWVLDSDAAGGLLKR